MRLLSTFALASLLLSSTLLGACGGNDRNARDPSDREGRKTRRSDDDDDSRSSRKSSRRDRGRDVDSSSRGDRDDTFSEDVDKIKSLVPGWDNGTGIGIRFLKESTGKRLSLIYVDPTPPEYKPNKGWLIQAQAKSNDKVLGHYLILLKNVAPGRYEGGPNKTDVVMASLLDTTWKGDAPGAGWSINQGSWCEISLRPAKKSGHLEGDFRAKLVTNDGDSFVTIENGYVYINPGDAG